MAKGERQKAKPSSAARAAELLGQGAPKPAFGFGGCGRAHRPQLYTRRTPLLHDVNSKLCSDTQPVAASTKHILYLYHLVPPNVLCSLQGLAPPVCRQVGCPAWLRKALMLERPCATRAQVLGGAAARAARRGCRRCGRSARGGAGADARRPGRRAAAAPAPAVQARPGHQAQGAAGARRLAPPRRNPTAWRPQASGSWKRT